MSRMTQAEAMVAAKAAVIGLLEGSAEAALQGVQVAWSHPGAAIEKSTVIVGNSRRDYQKAGPPIGRGTREASWRLELAVNVIKRGGVEETARAASEIAAAVEREIAANTELGIPETILYAGVTDADLLEGARDKSREAEIPLEITVRARLRAGA